MKVAGTACLTTKIKMATLREKLRTIARDVTRIDEPEGQAIGK